MWDMKVPAIEDNANMTLNELERVLKNFQRKLASREVPYDIALAAIGALRRGGFRGKGRGGCQADGLGNQVMDGQIKNMKDIECFYCLKKGYYQMSCPLRFGKEKRRKKREALRTNATSDAGDDEERAVSFFATC